MKKSSLITFLVIIAVVVFAVIVMTRGHPPTNEETIRCIGENSVLYIQFGCHACEIQENMFAENYQYLNVIDCFYEQEKCSEIQKTPTWIINREKYEGVQSIENLKELTGC